MNDYAGHLQASWFALNEQRYSELYDAVTKRKRRVKPLLNAIYSKHVGYATCVCGRQNQAPWASCCTLLFILGDAWMEDISHLVCVIAHCWSIAGQSLFCYYSRHNNSVVSVLDTRWKRSVLKSEKMRRAQKIQMFSNFDQVGILVQYIKLRQPVCNEKLVISGVRYLVMVRPVRKRGGKPLDTP